jgi:predicted transcriptional regulator
MKLQELKRETNRLLGKSSEEATWEDLMYSIYVRKKIDAGLLDSAEGRVVTSQQIRKSLKLAG